MGKLHRRNFNRSRANKADRPNKNKSYVVDVHGINSDGAGVGRLPDGKTVFVGGALPGEKVSALIIKENKSYCVGKLEGVLEQSTGRCEPFCSVASKCGGCTFQHVTYDEQLKMKYDVVYSALYRLGGVGEEHLRPIMKDVLGMNEPFGYRNKVQYPIGAGGVGFYAKHSHRIIEHDECRVQPNICEKIKAGVKRYVEACGCSVYDEKTGAGLLRHVLVRVGTKTNELMVVLVINGDVDELPNKETLIEDLREIGGEQLKSIFCNINTANSNVIMGEKCVKLFGEDCITEMIGDKVFKISPLSFFQVNTVQCKVLYDVVKAFAVRVLGEQGGETATSGAKGESEEKLGEKDVVSEGSGKQNSAVEESNVLTGQNEPKLRSETTIVDLYCGAGTIGIYLSDLADKIIGIEVVEQAVRNADENARLNNVNNATYICGEAEAVLGGEWCGSVGDNVADKDKRDDLIKTLKSKVDVLVVDPPRKGCDEQVLRAINDSVANSIIYVSCNPATLARDIKRLNGMSDGGWRLEAVQPVDMFPWTGHVETVALLSRQKVQEHICF